MILAIGDLHFRGKDERMIKNVISFFLDLIRDKSPTHVVILGDILHDHEKVEVVAMNLALDFFSKILEYEFVEKLIILVGNHDFYNNMVFLENKHWLNGLKQWKKTLVIDYPISLKVKELQIVCVPYVPPGRLTEALDLVSNWKFADIIFGHQEIQGAKMGAFESENGDRWESEYPLLVSGHIHDHQWLSDNMFYVGSSIYVGSSEHGEKVCVWIDDTGKLTPLPISAAIPRKITLDVGEVSEYSTIKGDILVLKGTEKEISLFKKNPEFVKLKENFCRVVEKPKLTEKIKRHHKNARATFREILDGEIQLLNNDGVKKAWRIINE